jgi:hypothetical protein
MTANSPQGGLWHPSPIALEIFSEVTDQSRHGLEGAAPFEVPLPNRQMCRIIGSLWNLW